jgi:hypothetical protein
VSFGMGEDGPLGDVYVACNFTEAIPRRKPF